MKPEKEIKWLAILYKSKYCKYFMKNFNIHYQPGCIKDFEKLLRCGENNGKFRNWFKKLLELGIFEYHSKITKGRNNVVSKGYIINGKELIRYAKTNSLDPILRKFYSFETL